MQQAYRTELFLGDLADCRELQAVKVRRVAVVFGLAAMPLRSTGECVNLILT